MANHDAILFKEGSGMEQTVKKKIGVRDIMTIAAMMVINFAIAMVIGTVTLPFPVVYLYGSAGIDAFPRRQNPYQSHSLALRYIQKEKNMPLEH